MSENRRPRGGDFFDSHCTCAGHEKLAESVEELDTSGGYTGWPGAPCQPPCPTYKIVAR